ncbi:MAG: M14 family metallocarboxypeptidase [Opitutales bacterium]
MEKPKASEWFERIKAAAPAARFDLECLGMPHGLPLLALTRRASAIAPRIYVSAGIHGDEPAGPVAVAYLLEQGLFDDRFTWTLCPLLNPGAWDAGTRENPDRIDLNRDYRHPISREIQLHRAWLEGRPPNDLYLSLHEDWEASGFYLYEINTTSLPSFAGSILDRVGTVIPREPMARIDNHEVTAPGLIQHTPEADEPENWPEAIFHSHLYPHLSYTFETPSTVDLAARIKAMALGIEAAIEEFSKFPPTHRKTGDKQSLRS